MIEISRADVTTDRILEDLPNAFLKLPISSLLEELNVDPIPSQIGIINAINKYRFVVAAISRRQGKTFIANIIGHCVSLVPGSNILIMSPNYNLSQISFELQRNLIKHHQLEVVKDNAKDKVIELANGSTVRMGSVNQADSVVGRSYDLIIFDEAAISNDGEDAFNIRLRPTLDKTNSRAIFISTPRGKTNWFSKFFDRGFDSKFPEWCSIRATYKENPRMSEEDVADAKASMSKGEFDQEYNASFNNYEGQIWSLSEDCVREHHITPENRHKVDVLAGLDLGYKDPTAMVIIGYDYENEIYYVLDEYFHTEKTTSKHAAAIQRLITKWDIDFIYIDSAAQQTRFDLARDYDIATINANKKSVVDSIGYVASIIEQDRLIIPPENQEVLNAIDGYRWDPNPNLVKEKPVHNMASHMADALRYALYSHTSSVGSM